jgi:3-oxoacyl-[acyl-carrier-protein] synthase-3
MDVPIGLRILGTGEYAPTRRVPSTYFDERAGREPGWTELHTGVGSRGHALEGESVLDMGAAAARQAVERAGLALEDIDAIVSVGSIAAQPIPCTAALLQRELGLGGSGIPAFDVNATCLGFLAAFDLLAPALQFRRFHRVLLVASERPCSLLDWNDIHTAGLFGDGAGAVVLGVDHDVRTGDPALLATHYQTFGDAADLCRVRGGGSLLPPRNDFDEFLAATHFEMRGPPLYRFAAQVVPAFLATLFARAGKTPADIDLWVAHQASGKALRHMRDALDIPDRKFVSTLHTHGNQVAASLPIALHHGFEQGKIRPGMTLALVGTGAGFSVGGAVVRV